MSFLKKLIKDPHAPSRYDKDVLAQKVAEAKRKGYEKERIARAYKRGREEARTSRGQRLMTGIGRELTELGDFASGFGAGKGGGDILDPFGFGSHSSPKRKTHKKKGKGKTIVIRVK